MDNADKIVNEYFDRHSTSAQPASPADAIVGRYFAKQQGGQPHPLDDSVISAMNDTGDQGYNGLCESFAEKQVYGRDKLFSTAADAWNNYAQEGKAVADDPSKAPSGALIYFSPDTSNNGDGHVGISDGQGNFISATSNGVQQIPVSAWVKETGQKPLGYVIP